jgi:tetratricopeptide (TPR) repeat protein
MTTSPSNLSVKRSALNVERSAAAVADAAVDPGHPWLGLASFTEETRAYFHGRDEEVAELGRRVQRKLLTILFGQSGLGKTSILRAGLVPRLRPEGYCPVYVRIDYGHDSPPPSEQIKQAILRTSQSAGQWSQPGVSQGGETLWEFLHHRDDVLRDAVGRTLIPLLIFDQFEEIFTLAQGDDFGRKRAAQFIEDLADLVENRAPRALEEKLERDEAGMERFDFARADYRILIALREDYLAHLEGLKARMPSITQNRMRLARMTGPQALTAVTGPGRALVTAEVAEAIVRFISGAADLARAEVEPSLLSLVCRELNTTRLSQGRAEISADLLAGSRDTILSEFYERALADQPAGVREFIEDELLTDSGYRESIAEERVKKGFAAAGAPAEALATLVDRRLLRVEERLDVRRVELTHDVLCGVVKASRAVRHEREALEQAERELATQRAREAGARRSLVRARFVAAVAIVLMLGAAGSAIFGWINLRRARVAEQAAVQATERTRVAQQMADTARTQAEKLVGFLLDDFYAELEPTGRLETVGKLAQEAVAYYDGLPAELRSRDTARNRGMALGRQGAALYQQGSFAAGGEKIALALAEFERLRAEGDTSEATTIGLALALRAPREMGGVGDASAAVTAAQRSADLLRPLASKPDSSPGARREYAHALLFLGSRETSDESAITHLEEARTIFAETGALDFSDLNSASSYASVSNWLGNRSRYLNSEESERFRREALRIAEGVLNRRPGDLRALKARADAQFFLAGRELGRSNLAAALAHSLAAERGDEDRLRFNPSDTRSWADLVMDRERTGSILIQQGRIEEGLAKYRAAIAVAGEQTTNAETISSIPSAALTLAEWESRRGNRPGVEQALAEAVRVRRVEEREKGMSDLIKEMWSLNYEGRVARTKWMLGDYEGVMAQTAQTRIRVAELLTQARISEAQKRTLDGYLRGARSDAGRAAVGLGRFAEAEAVLREALASPTTVEDRANLQRTDANPRTWLALAVARQHRREEALELLNPALAFYRENQSKGDDSIFGRWNLALALFVQAVALPDDSSGRAKRRAALDEASALLDGLSAEAKQLTESRLYSGWIAAERAK